MFLVSSISCFQSGKVKKFESNSQPKSSSSGPMGSCFQSGKDKRNTFIRYFSRVFFPESVFGYVTACPFRSDHLENPLPPEDADEVNRFYVVVPAPARSRIVNLRLPYVFIVIPSGECRLKTKDLHGSPGRFIRSRFRIPVGRPTYKGCFPNIFSHCTPATGIYPFYSTAGVPFLPLQEFKFTIINLEYICG